jgi:hypothetical protein
MGIVWTEISREKVFCPDQDKNPFLEDKSHFDLIIVVAVVLPFGKVGGLQDGEYPTNFVLKVVDGFWCDDSGDPCDGVLLRSKHFVCTFFVLLDILPLLVEAVAGQFLCLIFAVS